jgi:PhnB protein
MPQLNAYLGFNGNCAEAMRYYERVLGGKLEKLVTMADMPAGVEACQESKDRIMHACLVAGDLLLMAGDTPEHLPYEGMKGFNLTLTYGDVSDAERVFTALSDGGTVTMPFAEQFWADRAGMLVDRFGTPWIINGGVKEV